MWIHLLALRLIDGAGGGVAPEPETPSYSGEVVLQKPVYIRRGKKILLFATAAHADAFIEAEEQAQEAIEKAKSRQARRKVKQRVYEAVEHKTVDIDLLGELADRYAMPVDIPALLQAQAWDNLVGVALEAMRLQEEEDINTLFANEQSEYLTNLAAISQLLNSGILHAATTGPRVKEKPVEVKKEKPPMSEEVAITLSALVSAIEKINTPRYVIRDESGRIKGIA